jgi:hypothetical protein
MFKSDGYWERGYIFRDSGGEYLEEYLRNPEQWFRAYMEQNGNWVKSQYYCFSAGTGKNPVLEEIDEDELFMELL